MSDLASRVERLSPAKRKLLEQRLSERKSAADPIAIVGMACRFAGAASIEEFWALIRDGRSAISEIPPSRWDCDAFYDPSGQTPGKMSTRHGAFVDHVDQFDPVFFGIAPREAAKMDPQQRLLLEVAWEALESAGLSAKAMAGSRTGVFVGIGGTDYSKLPSYYEDYFEQIDAHVGTGNALSIASNRISYLFDFHGPSLSVDTACSSALVALHCAVQSLRNRDCDAALAGGVNLILSPEVTIAFSKARMLSPDGVCRPFDAEANGYVRGEGCGLIVLKRLRDAERDGDQVLAVIRATAVNQDGKTSGITAPNGLAQQQLIREALASAELTADRISYVEAHGTATPLGDPIETQALAKVFARRRDDEPPCYVTSVKANIGHTETVSGIAGLIKTVLLMQHGVIPPQPLLKRLNPYISLAGSRIEVPQVAVPWPSGREPRVAGVSSFGFGGTNVHVILAEPAPSPQREAGSGDSPQRPRHLLALSAKDGDALKELAGRYVARLQAEPTLSISDLCGSANQGGSHFPHRLAVTAATADELRTYLAKAASGQREPHVKQGEARSTGQPGIAFLFTGQGSQYAGMGRALYQTQPLFRELLNECDALLEDRLEHSLLSVMLDEDAGDGLLNQTCYTQPALFAIEYALARMWMSWGVRPSLMLGHSVGEYVAACIADVFSLEGGLKLVAERGRLMQQLSAGGRMAAVFAAPEDVARRLAGCERLVSIAAINGPGNTVISGDADAVGRLLVEFEREGVASQGLTVSHAFHSPLMEPMLEAFEQAAGEVEFHSPRIKLISNLSPLSRSPESLDADYWVRHVSATVRFAEGMQALVDQQPEILLEIGPAPQLIAMGRRFIDRSALRWLPSLRKGQEDWTTILDSLAELYASGVEIDWRGFHKGYRYTRRSLPTYPFRRSRQWQDSTAPRRMPGSSAVVSQGPLLHPLLGSRVPHALDKTLYHSELINRQVEYLVDHQVQGSAVVPAAAFMEMAMAAAAQAFGPGDRVLEEFSIRQAMFLPGEGKRRVQLSVDREQYGGCRFTIHSISEEAEANESWTLHASGKLCRLTSLDGKPSQPLRLHECVQRVRDNPVDFKTRERFYEILAARELVYGASFQVLGRSWRGQEGSVAEIELPEAVRSQLGQYTLHPALLDGCFQAAALVVPLEADGQYSPHTYMPTGVGRVRVHRPLADKMLVYARRSDPLDDAPSPETVRSDVYLVDEDGQVLVELSELQVRRVGRAGQSAAADSRRWLYEIRWQEVEETPAADQGSTTLQGNWLVLADQQGAADAIIPRLEALGASVIRVAAAALDPSDEHWFVHQVDAFRNKTPLRGVIHLGSLDILSTDSAEAGDGPDDAQQLGCTGAMRLLQALARQGATGIQTWFVTRDAQAVIPDDGPRHVFQSSLWGLVRCAALEHPELGCRLLDVGGPRSLDELAQQLPAELVRQSAETQLAFRDARRYVARLAPAERLAAAPQSGSTGLLTIPEGTPSQLRLASTGSFDGLRVATLTRQPPGPGKIEVRVHATGLNFSDVLKALGLYPGIRDAVVPLGIECSGVVTAVGDGVERFGVGDAVFGVVPYGFATHALSAEYAMAIKPRQINHEEAATIPIAFLTAYHALRQLADLQAGERVLIHAGAGGVGLAAIQIAQEVGAQIFATAGSKRKRDYLHGLGVPHVMDSRTLDFADQIRQITGGNGVDVVLNSLPGDAIDASLSVLGAYGRFLEIGKTDIYQNRGLGLAPFQDNLSYFAIDLDRMLRQRPESIRALFAAVREGVERGTYQPLPMTNFAFAETRDAFRFMAQRKNIGKVVVSMEHRAADVAQLDRPDESADTYLITGGLGALGRRVAESYAARGVGHLVLMSRSGSSEQDRAFLQRLGQLGVRACAVRGDVSRIDSLRAALQQIPSDFPPLAGVVHAAGVLDDGVLFEMTPQQLARAMEPKVSGAWNLHVATRDAGLQEFVLFSSVASVLGSPGQANYAAGNAFLDALAHHRRALGLAATSINWGPWADAGMAARDDRQSQITTRGMDLLPAEPALELLHQLVDGGVTQAAVMRVRWPDLLRGYRSGVPSLLDSVAAGLRSDESSSGPPAGVDAALRERLLAADAEERVALLRGYFVEQLSVIMGLSGADIDQQLPLNSLGLDSLMAIELKNQVETRLGVVLPMARFMEGPSVTSLSSAVAELIVAQPHASLPAAGNREESDRLPLSYGQQALWFLHQLAPESAAYHICDAVRVHGPLRLDVLQRATQRLVDHHAAFRTTFHDDGGRPYQRFHDQWPVEVQHFDASRWAESDLQQAITPELERPFDLENGPLLRVCVFQLSPELHVLVFCVHHIISDFWSLVACTQEFMQSYSVLLQGGELELPAPELDYASFVQWQAQMLQSPEGEQHWAYWNEQLSGELPMLSLPTDRPRPEMQTYHGALAFHWLDAELTAQLKKLAEQHGATLNMLLLAAYHCLLHRLTGQDDLIVGLPTSGRSRADFAALVGYFVNPVPVRADLRGNPRFAEVLKQIRQRSLGALEHQDFPLPLLVERLNPPRDPSRSTLFQTAFVMQKAQVMHEQGLTPFLMGQSGATLQVADLTFESMTLDQWVAQLDLSLAASEAQGGTSLGLQYNTDLFEGDTAERLLEYFETLLRSIASDPLTRVSQLQMLSAPERQQLAEWSCAASSPPSGELVHERIARQAAESPDAVAVVCGDQQLSFAELDCQANRLAHLLRARGAAPGQRIGLCLDRSIELVIAMQAILRAGAAYVPMDPSYPPQRLSEIASSASMAAIVTSQGHAAALQALGGRIVCLDRDAVAIAAQPSDALPPLAGPDDLIYVIYTSGSTGVPKGAGVYHRGFTNLMDWYLQDLGVGAADRILVITSHGFDLTQKNFYASLMTGGQLHLSQSQLYDPAAIRDEISRAGITVLNCTPSHIYGIAEGDSDALAGLNSLRLVVLGGEPIDLGKLENWMRQDGFAARIVNSYGPTECSDVVIYHCLADPLQHLGEPVPLGRPLRNVQALLLDEHLGLVPPGSTGELCLAGICLGAGYINDAALTSRRFVPYQGPDGQVATVYRTGDLCRYTGDGVLEFLGRSDHQVKLRGFRIELGEIEHVLMAHPGVRRAVVIVREDAPGVRYLVAYVVPEDAAPEESAPGETGPGETGPSAVDWREYLRQALPPHMVPQAVVCLDEIPLNPHGKLDRRSLPAPARDARPRTMPASEQEKLLAEIWGELLHQAEVSLEDSFFTLGGDSLLTIELVARLGRRGWRCTPAQVFQHQTLAELASALVRSGGDAREQVLIQGDVPLLPIQHWFFALGLDRPSYFNQSLLLEAPAGLRRECLNRAVAAILTHHDVLRTRCAAEGDGWRQWIAGDEGATPFQSFDLSQESESGQQEQIERMCGQVQGSLDLESGPLLRVVHFDLGNRRPARLLLCLHHLIVDPYSWRILLEDLLSAYQQAAAAQRILLPPKTTSCQSWSRRLVGLARDAQRLASLRQWAQGLTAAASAGLRVDVHDGDNTAASAEVLSITLSAAETARFLESAARQIDQSLCYLASALAVAHQRWAGAPLLVDVERHGRDPVVPEVDLSRTVGWLVAMFPVLLDHRAEAPVAGTLEQIARQISAVPLGGLGYGLLRYVAEDPTCRAALEAIGRADVRLNYLGRLDRVSRGQTEVRIAALRFGNEQAADSPRPHLLEIDARISGDQLLVEWTYSRNRHSRESIAELAHHFVSVLRELLQ